MKYGTGAPGQVGWAVDFVEIFLLLSAMGRLGVRKSFIVDVTLHFGSSNPFSQNCCDFSSPPPTTFT